MTFFLLLTKSLDKAAQGVVLCVAKGSGEMPKYIRSFTVVEFKAVTKICDKSYDEWKWRERYIGYQGELFVFESLEKHPGKRYLNFTDHSRNWLNTGCGEYVIEGNILTMTTKNSIYEFEIIYAG